MTDVEGFFDTPPEPPADPLRNDLIAMIKARDEATPRHLQREPGPSDVAHPCMRRLAYHLLETPQCNPSFDPLPSIIGTATHEWLKSAATHANMALGRQRWLAETRVNVTAGLAGSCDLYDNDTTTVVDFKVPGANRFTKYCKDPGPVYKTQVFLYGKGFENAGLPVKQVAIAFLPRGGTLRGMHLWKADYDPAIAEAALARRAAVIRLLDDLHTEARPETFEWIPKTGYDCGFCSWHNLRPSGPLQCEGENV